MLYALEVPNDEVNFKWLILVLTFLMRKCFSDFLDFSTNKTETVSYDNQKTSLTLFTYSARFELKKSSRI